MKIEHLADLKKNGHEIGMHGYNHFRLNQLSKEKQSVEISRTVEYWSRNKLINKDFTFCYPF